MTMASNVPPYGTVIIDALKNPKTKLEDLRKLHAHAEATLRLQGDLKGSLQKLDAEIKRREKAGKA
jgi:hypothetical protein